MINNLVVICFKIRIFALRLTSANFVRRFEREL